MVGSMFRMVAKKATEIWWKIFLKEAAKKAAEIAVQEGARSGVQKLFSDKKKPLKKKLIELEKMLNKKIIVQSEYDELRKRIIKESDPSDL